MTQAIGPQIRAFTDGFYEVIPHHLISLFNEYELVSRLYIYIYIYNYLDI